ncbi:hypothetical protein Tco_0041848 [Tanacetum coccineum]
MMKPNAVKSILKKHTAPTDTTGAPMNKFGLGSKIRNIEASTENLNSDMDNDRAGNEDTSGKKDDDECMKNAWGRKVITKRKKPYPLSMGDFDDSVPIAY